MRRGVLAGAALCAAAIINAPAAWSAPVAQDETTLVSRPTGFGSIPPGNLGYSDLVSYDDQELNTFGGSSGIPSARSLSADGRFVVFMSVADGMAPDDNNRVQNIYVRDRDLNTTTLVSRANGPNGEPANGDSFNPTISADGNVIAFASVATNLSPADGNARLDIYVRKIATAETLLVSRGPGANGTVGNGSSGQPAISGDGTKVAWSSTGSNFLNACPCDGDEDPDIYIRTLATDSNILASRQGSTKGDRASVTPSLSTTGSLVAYATVAQNLVGANNGAVVVTNTSTFVTEVANAETGQSTPLGTALRPSLAYNGSGVAFQVDDDLGVGGLNNQDYIAARTLSNDTTSLISRMPNNVNQVSRGEGPSVGSSLSTVSWVQRYGNQPLEAGAYFWRTIADPDVTYPISVATGPATTALPASEASISRDNVNRVAFVSSDESISQEDDGTGVTDVFVRRFSVELTELVSRPTGTAPVVSDGAGSARTVAISRDGRYVLMSSAAPILGGPGVGQLWLRDVVDGTTTLVSRADGAGGAPANDWVGQADMSPDGRFITFVTRATNLVAGATTSENRVYLRDTVAGTTKVASRMNGAGGGNITGESPTVSDDGNRVAFTSEVAAGDGSSGAERQVHVRDFTTNQTILASRADGIAGAEGNEFGSFEAEISGDGNRVGWASYSTNLVTGTVDPERRAYVRDLTTGQTFLVSRKNGPAGAIEQGENIQLDYDGSHAAFQSNANLAVNDAFPAGGVYVRDIAAATTTLVSRASGVNGLKSDHYAAQPSIDATGRRVAFITNASNFGEGTSITQVWVRDLETQQTRLVSRASGATGEAGGLYAEEPTISDDGNCVAFTSYADNLHPAFTGTDYSQVYARGVFGTCGTAAPAGDGGGGGGGGGDTTTPPPSGGTTTTPPATGGSSSAPAILIGLSRARVAGNRAVVTLRCPATAGAGGCAGKARVQAGKKRFGRPKLFKARAGKAILLRFPIPKKLRAALRAGRTVRATAVVIMSKPQKRTQRLPVRLKR
jgi:hypothetical protein